MLWLIQCVLRHCFRRQNANQDVISSKYCKHAKFSEAEEREERALFSETTDVMKVKKKGQSSSVQKADEDLSEEMTVCS